MIALITAVTQLIMIVLVNYFKHKDDKTKMEADEYAEWKTIAKSGDVALINSFNDKLNNRMR